MLKRLRRISLRWQVALGVALGFAFLFGIFTYLSLHTIQKTTNLVEGERLKLALNVAESVDAFINHAADQLGKTASHPVFHSPESTIQDQIIALDSLFHIMGTYSSLALLNLNSGATVIIPPGSELGQADLWSTNLIEKAGDGHPFITRWELQGLKHPSVALITIPIEGRTGINYVLIGSLHLAHLGADVIPLPKSGLSFVTSVIDEQGNILAGTRELEEVVLIDPHFELLKPLIQVKEAGVRLHTADIGTGHLVAYAPLFTIPGGVVIEEQRDLALAIPQDLRRSLLLFGLIALGIFSLGAWLHAHFVLRPVVQLEAATRRIARGSLEEPIATRSGGEIGELAASFEAMRAQLKVVQEERRQWERGLEERVRQRTQEVHRLLEKVMSAQEEERKRLARELHDETAQTLASLLVSFQAIHDALPRDQGAERELLGRALAEGTRALSEIRRITLSLRPSGLDELGLASALRAYAEDRLTAERVKVNFEVTGQEMRLPPALEIAIFRILQEAITNMAKHAQASTAHIQLRFDTHSFAARVEDDGVGFDVDNMASMPVEARLGLQGMRERADLIGAKLTFRSQPGRGTAVVVEMAVSEEESHGQD